MIIRFKILNLFLLGSPILLITPAVSFLLFFFRGREAFEVLHTCSLYLYYCVIRP